MPFITFGGQRYSIPGVYTKTEVSSSSPGPEPQFHVGVLLGRGYSGHPYDVASKLVSGETDPTPFKRIRTDGAAAAWAGAESEIHKAMRVAKRHGLPETFVVNLSPMVRASLVAETAGNVAQFTLYPTTWGPIGGWAKLKWDGSILTVTPVKRYAMIAANVGVAAVRIYTVGKHAWISAGAKVMLGANAVTAVEKTVVRTGEEVDANGQPAYWFEVNTAPGALTTAGYAMAMQYADQDVVLDAVTTCQGLIDEINDNKARLGFLAVKHASFSDAMPANVATATPVKELGATWGAFTAGTAPAPTNSDVQAFVAALNDGAWSAFVVANNLIPQTYLLVSSDSDMHATMRDYAAAERTRGWPISVTVGCGWGDVVIAAGDDTDPIYRVGVLNSQDVMLVANGFNGDGAYVSRAPAVWARRIAGGPGHNLTNDEFVGIEEDEVVWNEINDGELSALCEKGVVTNKLSIGQTARYRLSQGATTLQANANLWNVEDATTWSAMSRDLTDFVDRVVKTDFEEFIIGSDKADRNGVAQVLTRRGQKTFIRRGYLQDFKITSITLNDSANGWDVAWAIRERDLTDYVTVTTTVQIGE